MVVKGLMYFVKIELDSIGEMIGRVGKTINLLDQVAQASGGTNSGRLEFFSYPFLHT